MNLKIEQWPVDRLRKYERNARTHPDEQIGQITASIKEFGFVNPVLVDKDGTLIAGHGRLDGARQAGLETLPVIQLGHLTEAQANALRIADNRIPMSAGWDANLLQAELTELSGAGYDMPLLGFEDGELFDYMTVAPAEGADPEAVPEVPETPTSRTGDLWVLGNHRLLCGDSTNADDVARALAGVTPHLMVTDPPYGVEYDANWRNEADRANGKPYGDRAVGKVMNDARSDWREAWALFPGDVAYAWHPANAMQVNHYEALVAVGFEVRMQIIWAKQQFPIGRGHYHVQHEPCWYAVRKGKTGHWSGDRTQSTLWQIDEPRKSETGHSTQKPIECMKRPIENNSSPGQAVYEPFSGSGTTIIAAEITKRCCHAIEISPAYVDVAVRRWQDFAKAEATLAGDGRTFNEIARERTRIPHSELATTSDKSSQHFATGNQN